MKTVYLGLGSNIEPREIYIKKAIKALKTSEVINVEQISTIIETQAISKVPQSKYLNLAIKISTSLSPEELLDFTQEIETRLNRVSKGTGDPRTIDIDIL